MTPLRRHFLMARETAMPVRAFTGANGSFNHPAAGGRGDPVELPEAFNMLLKYYLPGSYNVRALTLRPLIRQ